MTSVSYFVFIEDHRLALQDDISFVSHYILWYYRHLFLRR